MGIKFVPIIIIGTIVALVIAQEQEDSLRGALNAINRRQRDLSDYGRYEDTEYGYPMSRPDDLDFLKPSASDYVDEDEENEYKKKVYSAFRERLAQDRQKQLDDITQNVDNEDYNNEDDYKELLHDLWEKYQKGNQNNYYENDVNVAKRYRYPNFGLDGVGLRKRNRFYDSDADSYYMLNYIPNVRNRIQDDRNEDDIDYSKLRYGNRERNYNKHRQYSLQKRFPVKKRSSTYDKPISAEKRSAEKRQTDPKVEKDLSNIFGIQTTSSSTTTTPVTKKSTTVNKDKKKQANDKLKEKKATTEKKEITKEVVSDSEVKTDKPLQIKKKSIDWSDYFGLDRRKKSEHGDINKEWLLNRYHKAVAMATKRNAEYPLQSFRDHDAVNKKDERDIENEENRIKEMDLKLRNMEDAIVDDALKFTGAHEGSTDPKEIQQVKERVISHLAAAYSLEKMRNALDEYKLAVAKEHEANKGDKEEFLTEEKRTSVPRKQAVDESRKNVPEADNNIKCAHGAGEDCQEQNYRTPTEIFEYHYGSTECPTIQKACNDMSVVVGPYGKVFEKACAIQQLCLLCNNNSWFSPTRQCNLLFLEKAYDLCKGQEDCRKEAQKSVRYLGDVSRSLQSQPQLADECELSCPNNEGDFSETPADTR